MKIQLVCLLVFCSLGSPSFSFGSEPPNIILILADDLGYADLSCHGSQEIRTPHIDSIADHGIRFTAGYVPASVCGPSRACLLTGRYGPDFGFRGNGDHIPREVRNIAQHFGQADDSTPRYFTAAIGKWHVGDEDSQSSPTERGFDHFCGFYHGGKSYFPFSEKGARTGRIIHRNRVQLKVGDYPPETYLPEFFTGEAVEIIRGGHDRGDRPFFLYLAFSCPHGPLQAPESYRERNAHIEDSKRRTFAGMMSAMDDGVGRIMKALEEQNLHQNTLVFFISDNGGPTKVNTSRNDPFRGGKGSTWEGGIRVPFMVTWPERLEAGQVRDEPISTLDVVPTVLAAAGIEAPENLDGIDLLPWLEGKEKALPEREFHYWRGSARGIREGKYKLAKNKGTGLELFDILSNPEENPDGTLDLSEVEQELAERMAAWEAGWMPERTGDNHTENRRWTGSEQFAIPLHDWSRAAGDLIAEPASFGGKWQRRSRTAKARLYRTTHTIGSSGSFESSFLLHLERAEANDRRAGIWTGLKSRTPSPRNLWIHPPEERTFIGLDSDGYLLAGDAKSETTLDPTSPVIIHLRGSLAENGDRITVTATPNEGVPLVLESTFPPGTLSGGLCLVGEGKGNRWNFGRWRLSGDALVEDPGGPVGPILWTQYTLQDDGGMLRLQAQMVPLEETDSQTARLQLFRNGRWRDAGESALEPLSSTFLFEVGKVRPDAPIPYRVLYSFRNEDHSWEGVVRSNPKNQSKFTLAVSNCDHGELFPQNTMVRNLGILDPDMLFFAGDQIYENMDDVAVVRKPLDAARLSYLGKWYQFGLTWRELLKDRPSVIIPDDHDVFMGNIWGEGGAGYVMEPDWVNLVQRTQTGSLPLPADPAPLDNGIGVYFTDLDYAGMSFAIIEDRKFKSQPKVVFGEQRPKGADPAVFDVAGARLLGERQLKFLEDWTARTGKMPVRFLLSQTMFAKANTHAGANLRRSRMDMDSNGWPQSARNEALRRIGRDTIMVHGDQHIGILARMGVEEFDDGPLAFMVTGASVGFPRAWWPEREPAGGLLNGPYTGRYFDDFGNRITVLGVTNPDQPEEPIEDVFAQQHAKGSGFGLITVDKEDQSATFQAFRLDFDAANPKGTDQFPGFPVTQKLK